MYNIKYNKKENLNDWHAMIKVYLSHLLLYVKQKEIRGQVFRNPNFKKIMNQQLEIDK